MKIDERKNDTLSSLRGLDLQELLVQIENYFLEYRDQLNLPSTLSFGLEMEYEEIKRNKIDPFIEMMNEEKNEKIYNEEYYDKWLVKRDGSLDGLGGEIISPILIDKNKSWLQLKKICEYLEKLSADTQHKAAGHIHIGVNVLGENIEAWKTFLKLYCIYEDIIFRFCYGDKITGRKEIHHYAPALSNKIYSKLMVLKTATDIYAIKDSLYPIDKYSAVNFSHVDFEKINKKFEKNTIEFRSPNASSNEVIWQNNINALSKMLIACQDNVIDNDFLDYKLEYEYKKSEGKRRLQYNFIVLKKALEFSDIIFDNNLDKIYFLRQYLKNFEESNNIKEEVPFAKKFVK